MAKKTIETGEAPQVVVTSVGSDLQVKGWDKNEVFAKSSSDDDVTIEERAGVIAVASANDCVLYVPQDASMEVTSVGSNARFRSVMGPITIVSVGSDLSLRDVGPVRVTSVGTELQAKRINGELIVEKIGSSALVGDVGSLKIGSVGNQFVAKRVRGDLQISQQVGGNAVIRDIDGQVHIKRVGGSLHLQDVSGGISVEVGGSATVEFSPVSWQAYAIQASGSIRCLLPGDADASFHILSGGQSIRVKTPEITETYREGTYTLVLGEGTAAVNLTAGSSVEVTSRGGEFVDVGEFDIDFGDEISNMAEEIAEQAAHQIEAQLEMLESTLNTHFSGLSLSLSTAGLSEERARELEERLDQARERAAQRAEEAAQRAQERLERKIAAAQRKAERKARAASARAVRKERIQRGAAVHEVMSPTPPVHSSKDPVSEQERLMILQMLQEKKISVDQAEQLLAALEGK
jgi:hypothetical protein